jgi:hypothetical protein
LLYSSSSQLVWASEKSSSPEPVEGLRKLSFKLASNNNKMGQNDKKRQCSRKERAREREKRKTTYGTRSPDRKGVPSVIQV